MSGRFAFLAIEQNRYSEQNAPHQGERPATVAGWLTDGERSAMPDERGRFQKGEHWREPNLYWNREWLYYEYIIKERSASEIAADFECGETNILYFLHKHQIPTRSVSETRAIKHWGSSGPNNPMYGKLGEQNPHWKGGIAPERQCLYARYEWKQIAARVREREKGICQRCGAKRKGRKRHHLHHLMGFESEEYRMDETQIMLLCPKCHGWVHSKANIHQELLNGG